MFANTSDWLLLLVDVSLKAMLLAVLAVVGLTLLRVSNTHVRHRVWNAVLVGMLLLPLLVQIVPSLSVPVPGLAMLRDLVLNEPSDAEHLLATVAGSNKTSIAASSRLASAARSSATPPNRSVDSPSTLPGDHNVESFAAQPPIGNSVSQDQGMAATALSLEWSLATLLDALVATYLGIAMLLSLRVLRCVVRATLIVRSSSHVAEDRSKALGAGEGDLWESSHIRVPCTIGFLKPRIVLPPGWRAWTQQKLDAVLQHERAHIARMDYAVNLLAECNRCLYWFHPLAWWLIRWLSDLAERNCDDAVITLTRDRTSYAKYLLEIASAVMEGRQTELRPGVSMARSADLTMRIEAILDMDRPLAKRLGWKSTVCFAALVLPVFWLAAALRAEAPPNHGADSKPADATATAGNHVAVKWAKVSGRVVDHEERPVSNALLSLVLYSHEPQRDRDPAPPTTVWGTINSAEDGAFAIVYPAIDDPEYYTKRAYRLVVIAQKDGFALGWKYVEFSDKTTFAEIKLSEEHVRRGRLVGLEGQTIAGATVHVVGVGKPAPKWIQFRKYPFHDGMPPDETTDTTIPVDEADRLWPHLVQFRHPPFAVRSWLKSVTSDDKGMFEIRGVGAGDIVDVHVYGTDQGGSKQHSFGGGGEAERTTLILDNPRTITGLVTDEHTGKPIAGAKVRVDGTVLIMAKMPIVADWKGRQDHVGNLYALQNNNSEFHGPAAETVTDHEGRYRLSAFGPLYGQPNFVLSVLSPEGAAYLSSRKWIAWPKKTTFVQQVDLQLTPGVRVTGQVVSADGTPVPRARIDFWSRELPYPYEYLADPLRGDFKVSPDGVQHPHWRKADGQGRFEMIVPHGESYLLINQGSDETVVDRIDATDLGLPASEVRIPSPISLFLPPRMSGAPHRFYPDRAVQLKYAVDTKADELTIQLHPKAPTLTVEVVKPDGTPATDLTYMAGQPPFHFYALSHNRLIRKIGDNKFSIPCRDLRSPISLAFLSEDRQLGLHREIAAEDVGDEVVKLTLQPLGQAKARFIDKDNKPLVDFRPLLWMSIPRKPVSTATDLEQQTVTTDSRFYPLQQSFDSVWTSLLDAQSHGALNTDPDGNATIRSLIPGATYRISQFGGQATDFTIQAGETIDLGEVVVFEPERTKQLPSTPAPKAGSAGANSD